MVVLDRLAREARLRVRLLIFGFLGMGGGLVAGVADDPVSGSVTVVDPRLGRSGTTKDGAGAAGLSHTPLGQRCSFHPSANHTAPMIINGRLMTTVSR